MREIFSILYENLCAIMDNNKIISSFDRTLRIIDSAGCSISYINPFVLSSSLVAELSKVGGHYFVIDSIFTRWVFEKILCRGCKFEIQNFDFSGIAQEVLEFCAARKIKIVVCGGSLDELESFLKIVVRRVPGVELYSAIDGYDQDKRNKQLPFYSVKSDVLMLVGLGSPKQESALLMLHGMDSLKCRVFTCGGFISQVSTSASGDYYPIFFRYFKIRFLYRFFKEPKTVARVVKFYPIFLLVSVYIYCERTFRDIFIHNQ